MTLSAIDDLMPIEKCDVQPYFSNRIQLVEVIEWVLEQTGPANMTVSTFSTSEESIRRFWRLKKSGRILSCMLFCDLRAMRKTISLYDFVKGVFDDIRLCENHSKVVLIHNRHHRVAIVTSQNHTRGNRAEAGIITSDAGTFDKLARGFSSLSDNSISLDEFQRRDR